MTLPLIHSAKQPQHSRLSGMDLQRNYARGMYKLATNLDLAFYVLLYALGVRDEIMPVAVGCSVIGAAIPWELLVEHGMLCGLFTGLAIAASLMIGMIHLLGVCISCSSDPNCHAVWLTIATPFWVGTMVVLKGWRAYVCFAQMDAHRSVRADSITAMPVPSAASDETDGKPDS